MYPMNSTSEQIQEDIISMFECLSTPFTFTDDDKQDTTDDLCDIVVHRMKDSLVRELRVDRMDVKEVVEQICGQHRTHQASIIRNLLAIVSAYHKHANGSDARNEAAVEVSKKIAEMEDCFIPYI